MTTAYFRHGGREMRATSVPGELGRRAVEIAAGRRPNIISVFVKTPLGQWRPELSGHKSVREAAIRALLAAGAT